MTLPVKDFPPEHDRKIPPPPGSPTQQPGKPRAQKPNIITGLPGQAINSKFSPNLQGKIHPEAERAIRVIEQQVQDLQDAVTSQNAQLTGGAVAVATVAANAVTAVTIQSGGYYPVIPNVSFSGGSPTSPAAAHAVMDGNRVVGVVIDYGGAGYGSVPTVVFTVQ